MSWKVGLFACLGDVGDSNDGNFFYDARVMCIVLYESWIGFTIFLCPSLSFRFYFGKM